MSLCRAHTHFHTGQREKDRVQPWTFIVLSKKNKKKTEEVTPEEEAVLLPAHSGVMMKDRFAIVYATIVLSEFSSLNIPFLFCPSLHRSKLSLFQSRSSLKRASVKVSEAVAINRQFIHEYFQSVSVSVFIQERTHCVLFPVESQEK